MFIFHHHLIRNTQRLCFLLCCLKSLILFFVLGRDVSFVFVNSATHHTTMHYVGYGGANGCLVKLGFCEEELGMGKWEFIKYQTFRKWNSMRWMKYCEGVSSGLILGKGKYVAWDKDSWKICVKMWGESVVFYSRICIKIFNYKEFVVLRTAPWGGGFFEGKMLGLHPIFTPT